MTIGRCFRAREVRGGRETSTEVLEVLDESDPREARIPLWERATDHYFARRWDEAIADFDEAARGLADPGVSYQIERCRALSAPPPGESWSSGVRVGK